MGPAPTILPVELDGPAREALAGGEDAANVAARFPTSPAAWVALADQAERAGRTIEAYAFARVGYHRGLDALRRAGWRGSGPIPEAEQTNRGVLDCLRALRSAAKKIGETSEVERLTAFLEDATGNHGTGASHR